MRRILGDFYSETFTAGATLLDILGDFYIVTMWPVIPLKVCEWTYFFLKDKLLFHFPKTCFHFQNGFQNKLSFSKCGSFSKCAFIFKMYEFLWFLFFLFPKNTTQFITWISTIVCTLKFGGWESFQEHQVEKVHDPCHQLFRES